MSRLHALFLGAAALSGCAEKPIDTTPPASTSSTTSTSHSSTHTSSTTTSSSASSSSSTPAQETVPIAWISKGKTVTTIYDPSRNGVRLAAADQSQLTGKQIDVRMLEPEVTGPDKLVPMIREAVRENVRAIVIAVQDADKDVQLEDGTTTTVTKSIDAAVAAGITVITWDGDAPKSKRSTYYNMDQKQSGAVSAKLLSTLMGGNGKILVISPGVTSSAHIDRMTGFKAELVTEGSAITVLPDEVSCDSVSQKTSVDCTTLIDPAIANVQLAQGEILGIYFSRGLPLRHYDLVKNAPNFALGVKSGKIFVVGLDSTPDALANMSLGYIHALIGQKYFGWGYDTIKMAVRMVLYGDTPPAFVDSGFDVVCQNNLLSAESRWATFDFRTAIPACDILP